LTFVAKIVLIYINRIRFLDLLVIEQLHVSSLLIFKYLKYRATTSVLNRNAEKPPGALGGPPRAGGPPPYGKPPTSSRVGLPINTAVGNPQDTSFDQNSSSRRTKTRTTKISASVSNVNNESTGLHSAQDLSGGAGVQDESTGLDSAQDLSGGAGVQAGANDTVFNRSTEVQATKPKKKKKISSSVSNVNDESSVPPAQEEETPSWAKPARSSTSRLNKSIGAVSVDINEVRLYMFVQHVLLIDVQYT